MTLHQDFGGRTEKPTWLYSNCEFIHEITDYATGPADDFGSIVLADTYRDTSGDRKFKGSKNLKGSQEYTKQFGNAVKKLVTKHAAKIMKHKRQLREAARVTTNEMVRDPKLWEDAGIADVMAFLYAGQAGGA